MTDRLTRIGEMAHGTVRHEDVCWMMDEIERLRNLKGVLMELGNRLVTEHGWEPAHEIWSRATAGPHTGVIAALSQQVNVNPEMRELLNGFGFDWPIVEEGE